MKNVEKTITGNVDPDVLEYTVGEDPVLDRVEHGLEETAVAGQPQDIRLTVGRVKFAESLAEALQKAFSRGHMY